MGGVWVGTVAGTQTSGTSENGYSIFASGTDENGNAVSGYILGKGNVEITDADGTLSPDRAQYYVHLLSAQSATPREGDLYPTEDGYKIWQGGEGHLVGDDSGAISALQGQVDTISSDLSSKADLSALAGKQDALSDAQVDAIDSVVNDRQTVVVFSNGTTSRLDLEGEMSSADIPNIGDAKSVSIGSAVTSIGSRAFMSCTSLTSVTIGNGVTRIGINAFIRCTSLTSVTIPNSVTSIRSSAFANCSSLTSVTIGNGVTNIEPYAFSGCTNLTSVTIGNGVTNTGNKGAKTDTKERVWQKYRHCQAILGALQTRA